MGRDGRAFTEIGTVEIGAVEVRMHAAVPASLGDQRGYEREVSAVTVPPGVRRNVRRALPTERITCE